MLNHKRNYQRRESTSSKLKYLSSKSNSNMEETISMNFQKIMRSSRYTTKMYLKNWKTQKEGLRRIRKKLRHNTNNLAENCIILRYNSKDNSKRINFREKEKKKILKSYTELSFKRFRAREQMKLFLRIKSLKILLLHSKRRLIDSRILLTIRKETLII